MQLRASKPVARSRPAALRARATAIAKDGKEFARHPRGTVRARRRRPDLRGLAKAAWRLAETPRRRRRSRRKVAAGAAGAVGAGAVVAYAAKRRSAGNGHAPGPTADKPRVHTTPQEGHPAGTGERTERDIGGPTSPEKPQDTQVTGGAPGTPPDAGFEPHE